MKTDVVATVAYEFRTPLTSLRMAVHMIVEGAVGDLSDRQTDLIGVARNDCDRLQRLVDDLLDLTRLQEGRTTLEVRTLELDPLIDHVLRDNATAASEKEVRLERRCDLAAATAITDPDRLPIVLANLIHHAPAGSAVTVATLPHPGVVRIEVADQGPGIAADEREAIFDSAAAANLLVLAPALVAPRARPRRRDRRRRRSCGRQRVLVYGAHGAIPVSHRMVAVRHCRQCAMALAMAVFHGALHVSSARRESHGTT